MRLSDIEYTPNSSKTFLKIPDVKLEDEGLYKCEATYLAVNRNCNNVQHIILNVTGEFSNYPFKIFKRDAVLYFNKFRKKPSKYNEEKEESKTVAELHLPQLLLNFI
ncbi:hypothetical protein K0M31_000234 [Melipona bicolor]|uniref:Ig-like domain-containing protein n=1 Tax=Melipona bicolor TaxID=60889 RepID=A0AA40KWV1_9HYME|nr:hypothetical protein K0M31_000234 [Melipona bicolor]